MGMQEPLQNLSVMSQAITRDLETNAETAPPLTSPGVFSSVCLPTEDGAEDINSELLLFNEQLVPNFLVSSLRYIPYYRTSEVFISPHSLIDLHSSTDTGESSNEPQVNTKQDENLNDSAVDTGYFPYYRSYEDTLTCHLSMNAEQKQPGISRRDRRQRGCAQAVRNGEKASPARLEPDKGAVSSSTEPPALPLLLESISANHASKTTFLNKVPSLAQPFASTGYFPYYRTRGELCISPAPRDRFFTRIEIVGDEGGRGEQETSVWNLSASCSAC